MWKKALWVYLVLYALGIVGLIVYKAVTEEIQAVALILPLFMFLPAVIVFFELRGKKFSVFMTIVLTLIGLLITAVPVVGMFNFDGFTLATIGKALIFVPMLVALCYFGYTRLFRKKETA